MFAIIETFMASIKAKILPTFEIKLNLQEKKVIKLK